MRKIIEATPADCLHAAMCTGGIIFSIDEFSLNYRVVNFNVRNGVRPVMMPDISVVIPSTNFLDTADPVTGFRGLSAQPQPEKVLRLWADDLLTISHENEWVFLINGAEPFDNQWLKTMFPKRQRRSTGIVCFVGVHFDTLPPVGLRFPKDEMLTPNAIFYVEDCRSILHP